MQHLVLGHGEIGTAIASFLRSDWIDLDCVCLAREQYEVLHVAIPYGERFPDVVRATEAKYRTTLTVVHSTVPIGTCDSLGAVHSPMRGVHPNLEDGLRTFTKFFGGEHAAEAASSFSSRGVECRVVKSARDTEALKLWDTTQHGAAIRLMQEIYAFCRKHELDFDVVYREANRTYNEGFLALELEKYCRPVLEYQGPGIGGHCVLPNAMLLDSETARGLK